MVVLPADRFSTTHHGKTVDDGTFTFFAFLSFSSISFFLFFFFFFILLDGTTNDESGNKGTRQGPDFTIFN